MKFLVDNQLPAGLAQASDEEICRYAELHEITVVSKDEDFFHLAVRSGATLRLVWVRIGNCRKGALLESFERTWPRIMDSLSAGDRVVELR